MQVLLSGILLMFAICQYLPTFRVLFAFSFGSNSLSDRRSILPLPNVELGRCYRSLHIRPERSPRGRMRRGGRKAFSKDFQSTLQARSTWLISGSGDADRAVPQLATKSPERLGNRAPHPRFIERHCFVFREHQDGRQLGPCSNDF